MHFHDGMVCCALCVYTNEEPAPFPRNPRDSLISQMCATSLEKVPDYQETHKKLYYFTARISLEMLK
jgi:hypothetical protein